MTEEALFAAALEKPTPAERAAFLDTECGADVGLRQRLEELLAAHEQAPGILDRAADDQFALQVQGLEQAIDSQPLAEGPGDCIGPYKLKEQIGEGGFGLVFVAEQQQPMRRKVALKIIKPGMDSREVIARFEAERQALAMMDHPNIAKVFDAGTIEPPPPRPSPIKGEGAASPQPSLIKGEGAASPLPPGGGGLGWGFGRPFFVMELVRGVAITDYCDQQQLTTRERLDLFISVCHAVQHAHQKGIIHRDLKPSNLLVTLHDTKPVVKVIDFGVAKALNQRLTEHSIYTRFAQMIGTPLYMSPEQAELSGLDIDTRADIYSLGVVLYELLTGTTPFDKERMKTASFDEIRRIIREEEPPKPSTRISTLGQAATTVSAQRKSDPKRLSQSLRGELDWIVMKALEKDRTRRYETASAFARDVQRYLADEPVEACPPSTAYRLKKFARKYKKTLATGVAFVALLIAGVIVAAWLAVRATLAEDRANDEREAALTAQTLAEDRFRLARDSVDKYLDAVTYDAELKRKGFYKLRKRLLEAALPFYQKFAEQKGGSPKLEEARGYAYFRLASIRREIGDTEAALADCAQMRLVFEKLAAEFPEDPAHRQMLAASHNEQGLNLARIGRHDEAQAAYDAALTIQEKLVAEFPDNRQYRRELATSHSNLAGVQGLIGKNAEAEAGFRAALKIYERLHGESPANPDYRFELARTQSNLGLLLEGIGKHGEADDAYCSALSIHEKLVGEFSASPEYRDALASTHHNRGVLRSRVGKPAEKDYRAALKIRVKLAAEFPTVPDYQRELAASHNCLGLCLAGLGKRAEAEAAYRAAAAILEKLTAGAPDVPAYAVSLGASYVNIGSLLEDHAQPEASLDWFGKGIATLSAVLAHDARLTTARLFARNAHWGRAEALQALGRHAEAVKDWDRAIELNDEKQHESWFSRARMKSLEAARKPAGM